MHLDYIIFNLWIRLQKMQCMNALEHDGFLLERKLSGRRPDYNFKGPVLSDYTKRIFCKKMSTQIFMHVRWLLLCGNLLPSDSNNENQSIIQN